MKTLKYTFAILFMTTFLIACEAEDVATDDALFENSTDLDDVDPMGTDLDDVDPMG